MNTYGAIILLTLMVLSHAVVDPWEDDLSKFDLRPKFSTHPMLFFNEASTAIFQQWAETTHKHIMRDIISAKKQIMSNPQYFMPTSNYEKFSGEWNEMWGNNLPPLALFSLLHPDDSKVYDFIIQYMDNMVNVEKWQVIGAEADEVPVNHQLVGFATAFDFLYPRFDKQRQIRYAQKVVNVTYEMYELSNKRWWGRAYIQNHVATNTVGLLVGALVSRLHVKEAQEWIKRALSHYEKTMWLFEHVDDGTSNEGVTYGGYTARSLTQYVYLVKRHFNRDHSQSSWLRNHFGFYYATILPGFQWSVGIADSAPSWWYGPESQLVFLDNYVLKNGSGNWLAEQIRNHRENNFPGYGQRWTTLHTEFLWYNASIVPTAPLDHGTPRVHTFRDWGVSTYGFATEKTKNSTFLSFKSGATHGRAIYDMIRNKVKYLDGWDNFNPGHEHPDKNSFVFAPNGELFISEGLYGPKYTYLDNTIMLGPSNESFCLQPWVGQLGDCAKWLQVGRNDDEARSIGKLMNSEIHDGIVHMAGEAVEAYPHKIGLMSWFRSLVLLNPQLLLVHDHIETKPMSKLSHFSAFFNNYIHSFQPYQKGRFEGFYINLPDGNYRAIYTSYGGQTPEPRIETLKAKRYMSNVNVTFALEGHTTSVAYLFFGPDVTIRDLKFLQTIGGVAHIRVTTGSLVYNIHLLNNYRRGSVASEYMSEKLFFVKTLPIEEAQLNEEPLTVRPPINPHESVMDQLSNSALMSRLNTGGPQPNTCRAKCVLYSFITVFIGFIIIIAMALQVVFRRRRSPTLTITLGLSFLISLIVSITSCVC